MNHRFRQIGVVLLAATYVVTGLVLEGTHHDPDSLVLNGAPTVSSHTCGNKEQHIPLDQANRCSACVQSAQRVSTPVENPFQLHSLLVFLSVVSPNGEWFAGVVPATTTNRGPPQG